MYLHYYNCTCNSKDVPLSVPGQFRVVIICPKLSVGLRSGLLAQCSDVMLCLPFFDNNKFAAGSIVFLEEVHVIVPIA